MGLYPAVRVKRMHGGNTFARGIARCDREIALFFSEAGLLFPLG
jgi:hypothetical protein